MDEEAINDNKVQINAKLNEQSNTTVSIIFLGHDPNSVSFGNLSCEACVNSMKTKNWHLESK